jgi:hypothetical protein
MEALCLPLIGDRLYRYSNKKTFVRRRFLTLGRIGTGMLGVPVLAGSCAYAVAEASAWRRSLEKKPLGARRFYAALALALVGGLTIDYLGLNAIKMMFWSAVVNGALAPPLILLVVLLTSEELRRSGIPADAERMMIHESPWTRLARLAPRPVGSWQRTRAPQIAHYLKG